MKRVLIFVALMFTLAAMNTDPNDLLIEAQSKIDKSSFISYQYTSLWPNPVGKIDTVSGRSVFSKKTNTYFDYDYKFSNNKYELMYIDDKLTEVKHEDSTVVLHSKEDQKNRKGFISRDNSFLMFSPLTLLKHNDWKYVKDTTMQEERNKNYSRVEMDTTINGKHIHVESHIFIDTSASVNRFERRAYLNNAPSQTITIIFSNYEFGQEPNPIVYILPENYKSQMYGNREDMRLLAVGEKAPDFDVKDIDGNSISLKSFQGKKVLLNFSVINCGYCKLALEEINRQEKPLPYGVKGVYINPIDGKSDVEYYVGKLNVPFPVVAGAKDIGKAYGVSAYPTFLLIDEEGVIEKVQLGYDKKFIESIWK